MLTITRNIEEYSYSYKGWHEHLYKAIGLRFKTSKEFNEIIAVNSIIRFFRDDGGRVIMPSSLKIFDNGLIDPEFLSDVVLEIISRKVCDNDVFFEAGIRMLQSKDDIYYRDL